MAWYPDARTARQPPQFQQDKERYAAGSRSPPMSDTRLGALRTRAYQLADTGRYSDWESLAQELQREGASGDVHRLGEDGLFKIMIGSRLKAARQRRR
jgi:hypothetical protein